MKALLTTILSGAVLLTFAGPPSPSSNAATVTASARIEGVEYTASVTLDQIRARSSWDGSLEHLPLNQEEAVKLASAEITRLFTKQPDLRLDSVALTRVHLFEDVWVYRVAFRDGTEFNNWPYQVVVLLDKSPLALAKHNQAPK
jgi:hypothetical protein